MPEMFLKDRQRWAIILGVQNIYRALGEYVLGERSQEYKNTHYRVVKGI